jgi:protoporphyrin/coproporphyrin ferrochelatase
VHHYELFDGRSPLNALTFRQARALEADLAARGRGLPVYVGMRNWAPYLHETLAQMRAAGMRHALGIVMAPHRSYSSWDQYLENVADARAEVGHGAPEVEYLDAWFDDPGFIEAQADRVAAALSEVPARDADAVLLFTAHSIPAAMAAHGPYVEQLTASARLVASRLGCSRWSMAYQSRSGDPRTPWLEPDVNDVIRALGREGTKAVVVTPIGFVCDHIEVLYDLDTEACATAREAGVTFCRAGTVMDHPLFIKMLGDRVRARSAT